jgi:hypothetical protein
VDFANASAFAHSPLRSTHHKVRLGKVQCAAARNLCEIRPKPIAEFGFNQLFTTKQLFPKETTFLSFMPTFTKEKTMKTKIIFVLFLFCLTSCFREDFPEDKKGKVFNMDKENGAREVILEWTCRYEHGLAVTSTQTLKDPEHFLIIEPMLRYYFAFYFKGRDLYVYFIPMDEKGKSKVFFLDSYALPPKIEFEGLTVKFFPQYLSAQREKGAPVSPVTEVFSR